MQMPHAVEPATFLERPNRFVVVARLRDGSQVRAHCPNPGRMRELLIPGARLYLSHHPGTDRRTRHTVRFVEHPQSGQLISLDTQLPNRLFADAMAQGLLLPFDGYTKIRGEVMAPAAPGRNRSRIDFRLAGPDRPACWVEVKSVSLVEEEVALFPDAPTARGRRHLLELTHLPPRGERAAVVFVVQRPDATVLRPNWATDPHFGHALTAAARCAVELYAYTCRISLTEMAVHKPIPIHLQAPA